MSFEINLNWQNKLIYISRVSAITAIIAAPISTALTSISCAVMLFSWLFIGSLWKRLSKVFYHPLGFAIIVFFIVLLIGLLYSRVDWQDRFETLWSWRKILYGLVALSLFATVVWKEKLISVYTIVMGIGLGYSYLSFYGMLPPRDPDWPGVALDGHTAQALAFTIAMLCSFILSEKTEGLRKWFIRILALMFFLNILLIGTSRSGYFSLLASLIAYGFLRYGWKNSIYLFLIFLFGIPVIYNYSDSFQKRLTESVYAFRHANAMAEYSSTGFRIVSYINCIELFQEKPMLGYGTGSFKQVYSKKVSQKYDDWRSMESADPHNQYLFIVIENGLIGLFFFLVLLSMVFFSKGPKEEYNYLIVSVLWAWLVNGMFNSTFKTFPEGHLIWLFLGAVMAGSSSNNFVIDCVSKVFRKRLLN